MLKKTCQSFIYCQILTSLISLLGKKKTLNEKQEPVMVMTEIILEIYDQNNISFNVGLLLLKIKFSLFFFFRDEISNCYKEHKGKDSFFKKIFIYVFGCARSQLCHAGSYSCSLQALGIVSCGMWDLVLPPRIEPEPLALEAQSLNHWFTRVVPRFLSKLLSSTLFTVIFFLKKLN